MVPKDFRTNASNSSRGIDITFRKNVGSSSGKGNSKKPDNKEHIPEYPMFEYHVSSYVKSSFNIETMARYYEAQECPDIDRPLQ